MEKKEALKKMKESLDKLFKEFEEVAMETYEVLTDIKELDTLYDSFERAQNKIDKELLKVE